MQSNPKAPTRLETMRLILLIVSLIVSTIVQEAEALVNEDLRFFDEKMRPLIEEHCFECHSHRSGKMKNGLTLDSRDGWATGGTSGPALVPGDPEKSLLIKAVRHSDPDLKMPPKRKLADLEVELLEEW